MNYPQMPVQTRESITVKSLNGGVNLRDEPFNTDDNQCQDINNMWFSDGALKTRPGFKTSAEQTMVLENNVFAVDYDITVFDTCVSPVDEFCRMIAATHWDVGETTVKFSLVDAEGTATEAGTITIYRTSHEQYSQPVINAVFYRRSTTGCGIYAMITLYNSYSPDDYTDVRFYELNSEHTAWTNVTSAVTYVPTIYINGSGNNYGAARDLGNVSFRDPEYPETFNRLRGNFMMYFGSDGMSNTFHFPLKNIDAKNVICDITLYGVVFHFVIQANSTRSETVSILNNPVVAELDRISGILRFYCGDELYPIPYTGMIGNNICIKAEKSDAAAVRPLRDITVFKEHSDRIFLSGSSLAPGTVYCSAQSNPFYYPVENEFNLGAQNQNVTALAKQGKLLIAFKDNETYSLDSRSVPAYTIDNVISGVQSMPAKTVDVRVDLLNSEIGCDCPGTLLNCANRLIWLHSSGIVYTIVASNQYSKGNVYELSLNIEPFLRQCDSEEMKRAFSVRHGGYYIIFTGTKAIAMDYTIKGFRYVASCSDQKNTQRSIYWYLWDMPSQISPVAGLSDAKNCALICRYRANEALWYGTVLLDGENDALPQVNNGEFSVINRPIGFRFRTKDFDFGVFGGKKFINRAYLSIRNKTPVQTVLYNGYIKSSCTTVSPDRSSNSGQSIHQVCFSGASCRLASIKISGEGYFEIGGFRLCAGSRRD